MPDDEHEIIDVTRAWIERTVIGLNLCPFAKAVAARNQIRYRVSEATSTRALSTDLEDELTTLQAADPTVVDTSLLIHPRALQDFFAYNDFLAEADALLQRLDLDGKLQIASFHPDYCFADSQPDDVANYTNRSPYPMLHVLREASVSRAVDAFPDPDDIYVRNIETLHALDPAELARLRADAKPRQADPRPRRPW